MSQEMTNPAKCQMCGTDLKFNERHCCENCASLTLRDTSERKQNGEKKISSLGIMENSAFVSTLLAFVFVISFNICLYYSWDKSVAGAFLMATASTAAVAVVGSWALMWTVLFVEKPKAACLSFILVPGVYSLLRTNRNVAIKPFVFHLCSVAMLVASYTLYALWMQKMTYGF